MHATLTNVFHPPPSEAKLCPRRNNQVHRFCFDRVLLMVANNAPGAPWPTRIAHDLLTVRAHEEFPVLPPPDVAKALRRRARPGPEGCDSLLSALTLGAPREDVPSRPLPAQVLGLLLYTRIGNCLSRPPFPLAAQPPPPRVAQQPLPLGPPQKVHEYAKRDVVGAKHDSYRVAAF